jgi:hypothetical protein
MEIIKFIDGGSGRTSYYYISNGFAHIHREDGPAIEHLNYKRYYLHDKLIEVSNDEEFKRIVKLKAFL